ncbi:MAG: hypothetical protein H6581_04525 [Bacteroidia bacterium]|nr:hypothetical protein [Bacteroidia bacterium]
MASTSYIYKSGDLYLLLLFAFAPKGFNPAVACKAFRIQLERHLQLPEDQTKHSTQYTILAGFQRRAPKFLLEWHFPHQVALTWKQARILAGFSCPDKSGRRLQRLCRSTIRSLRTLQSPVEAILLLAMPALAD